MIPPPPTSTPFCDVIRPQNAVIFGDQLKFAIFRKNIPVETDDDDCDMMLMVRRCGDS